LRLNMQFSLDSRHRGRGVLLRLCCLLGAMGMASQLYAQQAPPAGLHKRANDSSEKNTQAVTQSKSPSTLPEDMSGDYLLGSDPGDVIQVSLHGKELGGYISKRGDAESDQGTPLTFFFYHTVLDGPRLGFATYQIHGTWYSFDGTIVRGPAKSKGEEGYYLLQGTLMKYNVADKTSERRTLSLKLARQG
jgi:hypothetical protein